MITLVGVGHVFDISAQVRQIIMEHAPVAVALELDRGRLAMLLARDRGEELPKQRGMLAKFQERMAKEFGVQAGDEMLAGYKAAGDINAKVYLIDMNINRAFIRIKDQLSIKEKAKAFTAIFATPFIRKKTVEREMKRYAEEGDQYLEEIGRSLPTVKKVLLDERNEYMAKNLREIESQFGNVVALVGDGHVTGISALLPDLPVRAIRLQELRDWKPKGESSTNISFTFNV